MCVHSSLCILSSSPPHFSQGSKPVNIIILVGRRELLQSCSLDTVVSSGTQLKGYSLIFLLLKVLKWMDFCNKWHQCRPFAHTTGHCVQDWKWSHPLAFRFLQGGSIQCPWPSSHPSDPVEHPAWSGGCHRNKLSYFLPKPALCHG